MHAAPVLRGGRLARAGFLVGGLFLFACGIVCFLESRLGLPPWDVLHQGLAKHTPLSFGVANEAVGVAVLFLAWSLGARIWIGTVANAVLIGLFVVLLQPRGFVHAMGGWPLLPRIGLLVGGLALFGIGSAAYIGAALGAGPRDSLMLVATHRTGIRFGLSRAVIEGSVLVIGVLLGGSAGVGTVVFAAFVGLSVEASFWLVTRLRLTTVP